MFGFLKSKEGHLSAALTEQFRIREFIGDLDKPLCSEKELSELSPEARLACQEYVFRLAELKHPFIDQMGSAGDVRFYTLRPDRNSGESDFDRLRGQVSLLHDKYVPLFRRELFQIRLMSMRIGERIADLSDDFYDRGEYVKRVPGGWIYSGQGVAVDHWAGGVPGVGFKGGGFVPYPGDCDPECCPCVKNDVTSNGT